MKRGRYDVNFLQRERAQPCAFSPNSSETYKCTITFYVYRICKNVLRNRPASLLILWKLNKLRMNNLKQLWTFLGVPFPRTYRLIRIRNGWVDVTPCQCALKALSTYYVSFIAMVKIMSIKQDYF